MRRGKMCRLELVSGPKPRLKRNGSSFSGRNAVNGVITTDWRSGICGAAPTNDRAVCKEEKR